ncbi:hypothetical protein LXA43DRAFT_1187368 [Ganoderma leucocontextum]|nr:hypothetical protein LXA43DRAFT_1187368 [Ganoderma leucocontextum]
MDDYLLQKQMSPERVDERLDRLGSLGEEYDEPPPLRRKVQDVRTEFLDATKPRPVLRPIVSNCSDTPLQRNGQAAPPTGWLAPAQGFPNLPLDVFIEIASHAYPLDLLRLSRTSKQLRCLLMLRSSRPIWTTALGNAVELPPCPPDMCEPLYAALVFDHHCFACGANDAFWVDYALRVRMCKQCYKTNVVEGTKSLLSLPKRYRETVGEVVFMLVPSADSFRVLDPHRSFHRINPLSHLTQGFYFKPELETVLRLFWPLPEPEDITELKSFVRARVNYVMKRQAHASLILAWNSHLYIPSEDEYGLDVFPSLKGAFREVANIQLRGRGWDETPSDPVFVDYLAREAVECTSTVQESATLPIPLLARAYHPTSPSSLPKPNNQIARERLVLGQREKDACVVRIRGRYAEMADWYTYLLEEHYDSGVLDHDELPNAHDGARLWDDLVLEDDAHALLDVDAVMAESVLERVVECLREYPRDVKCSLAGTLERAASARAEDHGRDSEGKHDRGRKGAGNLMGKGRIGRLEDPQDAVRHPTALFQCAACDDYPYAWPEINVHWREEHPDKSAWAVGDNTGFYGRWPVFKAQVWEAGVEVAETVLAALIEQGLGKKDRDKARLDGLIKEGRVFCACGDPRMATPDEGLNWAGLVKHVSIHLNDSARRTLTHPCHQSAGEEAPTWIDDHELASCVKCLPKGADTSQAAKRVHADPYTRARINAFLSQCPEMSRPVCSLCDALTPDDKKDSTLFYRSAQMRFCIICRPSMANASRRRISCFGRCPRWKRCSLCTDGVVSVYGML